VFEIDTPHGPGRAHLHTVEDPRALLALGHGAGGGVEAPDLVAAREAARSEDVTVVLAEQPYRVAGRRSPAPASQLDAAWIALVEGLRARERGDLPLIVGGRSLGARVACRTAEATGGVALEPVLGDRLPFARVVDEGAPLRPDVVARVEEAEAHAPYLPGIGILAPEGAAADGAEALRPAVSGRVLPHELLAGEKAEGAGTEPCLGGRRRAGPAMAPRAVALAAPE